MKPYEALSKLGYDRAHPIFPQLEDEVLFEMGYPIRLPARHTRHDIARARLLNAYLLGCRKRLSRDLFNLVFRVHGEAFAHSCLLGEEYSPDSFLVVGDPEKAPCLLAGLILADGHHKTRLVARDAFDQGPGLDRSQVVHVLAPTPRLLAEICTAKVEQEELDRAA